MSHEGATGSIRGGCRLLLCTGVVFLILVVSLSASARGAVAVWNWRRAPDPTPTNGTALWDVSCSSRTACTAVGGLENAAGALVERWNGHRWSIEPAASFAESRHANLNAVSCRSKASCIAVGVVGRWPMVERWNGSRWSYQPTPRTAATRNGSLAGISCASKSCMAVGSTGSKALTEYWNGKSWSVQPLRWPHRLHVPYADLSAVSCSRDGACVAVGSFAVSGVQCGLTLIERWDRKRWAFQRNPGTGWCTASNGWPNVELNGVSCKSKSMCVAVGDSVTGSGSALDSVHRIHPFTFGAPLFPYGEGAIAERWNGRTWSDISPQRGEQQGRLLGVSCRAGACTGVGGGGLDSQGEATAPVVDLWNGITWTYPNTHTFGGKSNAITLDAVSCPSPRACIAVGWNSPASHSQPDYPIIASGP